MAHIYSDRTCMCHHCLTGGNATLVAHMDNELRVIGGLTAKQKALFRGPLNQREVQEACAFLDSMRFSKALDRDARAWLAARK